MELSPAGTTETAPVRKQKRRRIATHPLQRTQEHALSAVEGKGTPGCVVGEEIKTEGWATCQMRFSATQGFVSSGKFGESAGSIPRMFKLLVLMLSFLVATSSAADLSTRKHLNLVTIKTMVAAAEARPRG